MHYAVTQETQEYEAWFPMFLHISLIIIALSTGVLVTSAIEVDPAQRQERMCTVNKAWRQSNGDVTIL